MRPAAAAVAGGNGVEGVETRGARPAVVASEGMERPVVVDEVIVGERVRSVGERRRGEAARGDGGDLMSGMGQMTRATAELFALPGGKLERVGRHGVSVARGRRRRLRRSRSRGGERRHVGGDGGGDVVVRGGGKVADIGRLLVGVVGLVRWWWRWLVRWWWRWLVRWWWRCLVRRWRRSHFGNVLVVRRLESVLDLRGPGIFVLGLLIVWPRRGMVWDGRDALEAAVLNLGGVEVVLVGRWRRFWLVRWSRRRSVRGLCGPPLGQNQGVLRNGISVTVVVTRLRVCGLSVARRGKGDRTRSGRGIRGRGTISG